MIYDYRPYKEHNPGHMAPSHATKPKPKAERHIQAPDSVEDFTPPPELSRISYESMRKRAREVASVLGVARFSEIEGADTRLLTSTEVGFVLAVSAATLNTWEKKGILKPTRIGPQGREMLRYFPEDVKALIDRGKLYKPRKQPLGMRGTLPAPAKESEK